MEIYLYKTIRKGKIETKALTVHSFEVLDKPATLLLVKIGSTDIGPAKKNKGIELLQIYKLEFIAACNTELQNAIVVGFYVDEFGNLNTHVIDNDIKGYIHPGNFQLIDYAAYLKKCEMTGETILSFKDYLYGVRMETVCSNTLLDYNGRLYNDDEQEELIASKE